METNTESTTPSAPATKPARKQAAKKAAKPVAKKSGAKLVKKADGDRIPLKAICAKRKIEPRLARRKLRAAGLAFHDSRERWMFTKTQAAKVEEILSA